MFRPCHILLLTKQRFFFKTCRNLFDPAVTYFSVTPRFIFRLCRHPLLSMPRLLFYHAVIYFSITPTLLLDLTAFFINVVNYFSTMPRPFRQVFFDLQNSIFRSHLAFFPTMPRPTFLYTATSFLPCPDQFFLSPPLFLNLTVFF